MLISVFGCGYLGAVHAASMASLGHEVVGIEPDPTKVALLSRGRTPFHEPSFPQLLKSAVESGRLRFSTCPGDARSAEAHFVCVGTPQRQGELAADTAYVDACLESIIPMAADTGAVVIGKSTVPAGTAKRVAERLVSRAPRSGLVWNPEFLREGFAVKDTLSPDRIVYGTPDGSADRSTGVLDEIYSDQLVRQAIPKLQTDYATAELIKVAANSFLATKISFINAMAEMCEATGANVSDLAAAIGLDDRIGPKFLSAGIGFGGGCLPKDIRAFRARAAELDVDSVVSLLAEVDSINLKRRARIVEVARQVLDGQPRGRRVAALGATFKPNTDDIRDSPALDVVARLVDEGSEVRLYDPKADPARVLAAVPGVKVASSIDEALEDTELTLLLTEWTDFRDLDPTAAAEKVAERWIVDGRNALDPAVWRAAGWTYIGMGRELDALEAHVTESQPA